MAMLGENSWYLSSEKHATLPEQTDRQADRQPGRQVSRKELVLLRGADSFTPYASILAFLNFIFHRFTVADEYPYVIFISNKYVLNCKGKLYLYLTHLVIDVFTCYDTTCMESLPAWKSCNTD